MPTKNGNNETKKEILRVAERLLKVHGYNKTTYQMIANELKISKSVIVYHFKSKPLLVSYLFEIYVNEIHEYIKTNLTDGYNNYLYHCIMHICLYREVLKNKNGRDLFFHEDIFYLWFQQKLSSIEGYLRDIANGFSKDLTSEDLHINAVINQGAKKVCLKNIRETRDQYPHINYAIIMLICSACFRNWMSQPS